MFDEKKFNEIKEEVNILYKTLGKIYCPYFKEEISFNHKGLEHLEFKGNGVRRSVKDQYRRLKIFKFAPTILGNSYTLQGKTRTKSFEYLKINSRWEYILKDVIYYDFIAILEEFPIRVTVKQVENLNKYFWSIIPYNRIYKDDET